MTTATTEATKPSTPSFTASTPDGHLLAGQIFDPEKVAEWIRENVETIHTTDTTGKFVGFPRAAVEARGALPTFQPAVFGMQFEGGAWNVCVQATLGAAGRGAHSLSLQSVAIFMDSEGVKFVASDTHRLHQVTVRRPLDKFLPAMQDCGLAGKKAHIALLAANDLRQLPKVKKADKVTIFLSVDAARACPICWVILGNSVYEIHCIDGHFPRYSEIVPTGAPVGVFTAPASVQGALKILKGKTSPESNSVRLAVDGTEVRFSASWETEYKGVTTECETSASVVVTHSTGVQAWEVTANHAYIDAALGACGGAGSTVAFYDDFSPLVVRSEEAGAVTVNTLCLVMPIRGRKG